MKKLLLGLTLLASTLSFAGNDSIDNKEAVQSRGFDALVNIYITNKIGETNERSMSKFNKLMDQADDTTQDCLIKARDLVLGYDVDEALLVGIQRETDKANDRGQNCLAEFEERLLAELL